MSRQAAVEDVVADYEFIGGRTISGKEHLRPGDRFSGEAWTPFALSFYEEGRQIRRIAVLTPEQRKAREARLQAKADEVAAQEREREEAILRERRLVRQERIQRAREMGGKIIAWVTAHRAGIVGELTDEQSPLAYELLAILKDSKRRPKPTAGQTEEEAAWQVLLADLT